MILRFILAATPLATVALAALCPSVDFATDGDAAGNALRFMAWGLAVALGAAFFVSAHLYLEAGRTLPREAARRVRRRLIAR